MDKDEWLRRCSVQFQTITGLPEKDAAYLAIIELEEDVDGDFADDPEGAADSEMSYWDDDE